MFFNWLMSGSGFGVSEMLSLMLARLIVAVVIIFVLVFLFKSRSKIGYTHMDDNIPQHSNDLLSLLNERLVKGEITIEEYQKLKMEILKK